MSGRQTFESPVVGEHVEAVDVAADSGELLRRLVHTPVRASSFGGPGVSIGELAALADDGKTPLVIDPATPHAPAQRARSVVDLHATHIGQSVVLMFEQDDPSRPIVMGVLKGASGWPLGAQPAQVEVTADGERMVVTAREQLILRCGKASITLTKTGKVLIEGSYVLSRSTGVNRVKGGSVQLN